MKTTLSERDGNTVKLAVEVSTEELQEAFDKKLRQLSREVRLPGFRPGKAPASMIRQRLSDEAILVDAVEESMGAWFAQAAIELDLDPVDRPEIELDDELPEMGRPLGFKATVTVMPEVVLGEYKGLEAPKEPTAVEAAEVDAQMDHLRDEFAELRPVGDRTVQQGDFITADLRAAFDGEPVENLEASDFVFDVGGGRIFPEAEEQVVGMSAEEEKTFPLTLPEELPDDLAGKTVDFTVVVKEIKEKVLPPLTDKWVSEVSEFATLLELRQEIRSKITMGKEQASDQRFRALAVKAVADNAELDLPDVVVREQAEEMVADFQRSLESRGGSLEVYSEVTGQTVEQLIEEMKPTAANNVKTGLVLSAVAKAEGLVATDDEVEAVVAQMAAAGKVDAKVLGDRLRQSGRIESLKEQMLRDKAADFIAANTVAVEPETEVDVAPGSEAPMETASAEVEAVPETAPVGIEAPENAGDTAAESS